ncbi:MAG: hypothetical protein VB118_03930, partial [Oscillospiraceae bacterium]|nr:hypothetical protein [Oscillospiraceae bacterium]
ALMTLKDYDYTDGAVKLYELGFLFSEAARFPTAELSIWECPGSDGRVIVSLTDYGERLLTKEESAEIRAIYAKAHEAAKSNNETFFNHKSQQHRLLPDGIISLSHGKYDIGFYAFTSDLISPTFCTIIPGCPEETSQKLFCFGNKYDFFISRDDGNTDIPKCSLYLTKGIYCNYLFNGYTPKEAVVKIVTGKFEVLSAEQKSPTQFLLTLSDNSEYDYAVCRVNGFISDYGCLLPPYPLSWTKEDVFVVLLMKDVSREEALKAAEGSSFEY